MKRGWVLPLLAILAMAPWAMAENSAIVPVPREDEWWQKRYEEKKEIISQGNVDLLFIGDSITHGWEGDGKAVWEEFYGDRKAANIGFGGDRTEHVLWRLENGHVTGISPKLAVLMIGTNNHRANSAEEIAEGVQAVVASLREKLPQTKILVLGIFPRQRIPGQTRQKLDRVNAQISKLDDNQWVHYMDIGQEFLEPDGTLLEAIMPDALHPNEKGYWIWARAIEPKVAELLGDIEAGKAPKGFVPLFNGKDLTGWKGLVADPEARAKMTPEELAAKQAEADASMNAHWSVVDGALTYDGGGESLCTARDYEDFEMLVDWKIPPKGDSGVYLRGSPQVQIWDPAEWPVGSGGLYNNKIHPSNPILCADNPIGEWNRFKIRMIGEEVWIWLNDQLVVDQVVLENYWNREIPIYPSGQIELQHHGSQLWFDNVYIREIPRGEGWKDLFNGENLEGWEQVGGENPIWFAEDGILYTDGEGGGWLSTTEEYGNFELELEFRVPEGGNSGVFCRTPREGNPAYEGFEVQVLDDAAEEYSKLEPWQYTGSVYSYAAPSRKATLPAGTWQKMRILCDGSHVKVNLNGVEVVDTDLSEHESHHDPHPGLKRNNGYIGLQNHGSRLDYRNIRIRNLY
jgi:lysophospholipase L1-like esterase